MNQSSTLPRKIYGRIDKSKLRDEGIIRLYLNEDADWYIDCPPNTCVGEVLVQRDGKPTHWVQLEPGMDFWVSRWATTEDFLAFLDVSRVWSNPARSRMSSSGRRDKEPIAAVRAARSEGNGGFDCRRAPAVVAAESSDSRSSDTDTSDTEVEDYVDYNSCPTSLGFRC